MRHGKAEDGSDKADYKRKLIPKGIKRSQKLGEMLKAKNGKIEAVLCSNANRTAETAEIMAAVFDFPLSEIQKLKELYLSTVTVMLDSFYAIDNKISHVLVVGHNPGVSELVTSLSGDLIDWMPTSALFAVEIDTDKWEEIGKAPAKIAFSINPKNIG